MKTRICKVCGKEFEIKNFPAKNQWGTIFSSNHSKRRWCSPECKHVLYLDYQRKYAKSHKSNYVKYAKPERTECKCPNCGKKFLGSPWQGYHSYCDDCALEVRGMTDIVYEMRSKAMFTKTKFRGVYS